jgi:DNA polymerase III epsilon subunit-like protein
VAHYLGYRTFRHHHAFEDCKACAYIIDKLAEINQTNTIEDLIHAGGYKHFGHVHSNETWYGFTKKKTTRYANSFTSLDYSKGNNANKEDILYRKMLLSQGNEKA